LNIRDGTKQPNQHEVGELLVLNIDGFEGPLDLLLTLARRQKVDLRKISILQLVEQYLNFLSQAESLKIEKIADYLLMAAWLAFLKSRLLLPKDSEDNLPDAEELAANLAYQLQKLEAMRVVSQQLFNRAQLGVDFFSRGENTIINHVRSFKVKISLLEIMQTYSKIKTKKSFRPLKLTSNPIFSIQDAIVHIKEFFLNKSSWNNLAEVLPTGWQTDKKKRRVATASTFVASLELVKVGAIEFKQEKAFSPIMLRVVPRAFAS
jgi:segregation and condensation protein A